MKNRITKTLRAKAGFTLVELIVVIAILGILAGVGTVGYSGYIKKANMAADQQLAAGVKNALELATYTNPAGLTGGVVLSTEEGGTKYLDATGNVVTSGNIVSAIEAAFGANPDLRLKYSGWAGAKTTANAIAHFKTWEGTALEGLVSGDDLVTPSFKNEVDELYDLIETTSIEVGDGLGVSGAELIKGAASLTMGSTALNSPEAFASAWGSMNWDSKYLMKDSDGSSYNADSIQSSDAGTELLQNAVANAAVIKARNTSLATYLRNNNVSEEVCAAIENCTLKNSRGEATIIPQDVTSYGIDGALSDAGVTIDADQMQDITNYIFEYTGMTLVDGIPQQPTGDDLKNTQIYKDGLAYYAMMNTIEATPDNDDGDDATYWENMRDAVSTYGKIARGEITLDELDAFYGGLTTAAADNGVIITVVNGAVTINPASMLAN